MKTEQITNLKYELTFDTEEEFNLFKKYLFPKKQLKAGEVMNLLGVSRETVCHYLKRGLIKAEKVDGGQYKYDYDSVMKLIANKN